MEKIFGDNTRNEQLDKKPTYYSKANKRSKERIQSWITMIRQAIETKVPKYLVTVGFTIQ